jgi:hypothetical protein
MQLVFAYAEARLDPESLDFPSNRRTLYTLKLAFSTDLRIHGLAAASFGDIECLEDDAGTLFPEGGQEKQQGTRPPCPSLY